MRLRPRCDLADEQLDGTRMKERSLVWLWHSLKYGYREEILTELERRGFRDEARQYRRIWGDNPEKSKDFEKARDFAFEQELKACQDRSSRVVGHAALASTSGSTAVPKRLVRILLVDDQERWWERLRRRARFQPGDRGL